MFMLLFLSLFVASPATAQSPILPLTTEDIGDNIPNNAYLKDLNNDLDKFVGTWEYFENGEKLTINIQKIEMYTNENVHYYQDVLEARYKFEANGSVIIDNLLAIEPLIYGSVINPNNSNKLIFVELVDPQRKRVNYNLELTHQIELSMTRTNALVKLVWDLKITEIGWCGGLPDQSAPAPSECLKDNRLPLNVRLTKI
jgi:hypothetical protein